MKITSIAANSSDDRKLVFRVNPPMTIEVLNYFNRHARGSQILNGFSFSLEGNALVMQEMLHTKLNIQPGMADEISRFLEDSEQEFKHSQDVARQQQELEQNEKKKAIASAAKMFGVPVQ